MFPKQQPPKAEAPPRPMLPPGLGEAPNDMLAQGARGPLVSSLQLWLHKRGFTPGAIDGIYGAQTASAVRELQKTLRVSPQTGNMDQATMKAVNFDLAQQRSVLRDLEEMYLTRPPPKPTSTGGGTIKPNEAQPDVPPAPGMDDKTRMWLGVGLGGAALLVLGYIFMADKKSEARPLAGEDLFDDLGRDADDDEKFEARSDDEIRLLKGRVNDREYMRQLADDYAKDLADRVMARLKTSRNGGKQTEPAPAIEGLADLSNYHTRMTPKQYVTMMRNQDKSEAYLRDAATDSMYNEDLSKTERAWWRKVSKLVAAPTQAEQDRDDKRIRELESELNLKGVGDAPPSSPKGRMQACASQWRSIDDKSGSYRDFMKDCMKSFPG